MSHLCEIGVAAYIESLLLPWFTSRQYVAYPSFSASRPAFGPIHGRIRRQYGYMHWVWRLWTRRRVTRLLDPCIRCQKGGGGGGVKDGSPQPYKLAFPWKYTVTEHMTIYSIVSNGMGVFQALFLHQYTPKLDKSPDPCNIWHPAFRQQFYHNPV